ncbi:transglycosylase SLT domain-containing protein [Vreelandella subglaciescola]|uniref:Soluble lytic murein transglycosylase n=1 Tax=Vreelandella subglaciescola TaxID=29571 RepID=A0A1M7F573_9GAMM|nr:transglycosylase SLT domain-containing protein [Halomonas subglaciescola]SHL99153.1 soluble lytic murein transglycosylase [Halomonas subglaciescola]
MHAWRRRLLHGAKHARLAGAVLLAGLPLTALAMSDATMSDSAMRDALADARDQRFASIDRDAVASHVLRGYIDYHRLRGALPAASPARVNNFIKANADAPLAEWMRGQAISAYGKAGQFSDLRAVANDKPGGTARQCYYYTALLDSAPAKAQQGGKALWLVGHSQPAACDTLFDRLQGQGVIDDNATWERAMLAWQGGENRLMDYLLKQLDERWHTATLVAEDTRDDPVRLRRAPDCLGPRCAATDGFYRAAMERLTRDDTDAAFAAWQAVAPRVTITPEARRSIQEELAFYALVRETPGTLGWVDGVLPTLDSERLRELRVRRALADRDWRGVRHWVVQMPVAEQENSRWQYWLARADEQLGDNARANTHYQRAAGERDFYGFAAADRLGQPYSLNLKRYHFDATSRGRIAALPAVRRTEALIRIGETGLATSEWLNAVRQADPQRAQALADYAAQKIEAGHTSWPARLVQTTIAGKMWDALEWRFPEAYRDKFQQFGQENGVDPYLLMAIARRESAYNPKVRSPAGALGLMQLMPGTADDVSRSLGLPAPGRYGVLDPALNVRLGSAYFSDTQRRYRGNRLAATAAYNAGPSRVDRWLGEHRAEEFDLFVERIPFRETRHYVQAVLTYRVIFQSLAQGGDSSGVTLLSDEEQSTGYNRSLMMPKS